VTALVAIDAVAPILKPGEASVEAPKELPRRAHA
jgi:hypothetical protein